MKAQGVTDQVHFKDAHLERMSEHGNVAQFVSFAPSLQLRYSRIAGYPPNFCFSSASEAIAALLESSPEKRVNIRSFLPEQPQGHEFVYGIRGLDDALGHIRRFAAAGLYVIVNETVDIDDGGVSGVAHAGVIEFSPAATPRVVETGDIVSARRDVGERIISSVYGFSPELPNGTNLRVEFSVHPLPRGFKRGHTIIWEVQEVDRTPLRSNLRWPNRFSEMLGDKAFGLLLAHCYGIHVPWTEVIARRIAPFSFGIKTGARVRWIRTCPRRPEPGHFPTIRGWSDIFELIQQTPGGDRIASVIVQQEVGSKFSGALLTGADQNPIIEGVRGFGDDFMLGKTGSSELPQLLKLELKALHDQLYAELGSVRAEWGFDGEHVWLLQLQQEKAVSLGRVIVPGEPERELDFDVKDGVKGLRELVRFIEGQNIGVRLLGSVGMTSHIADILRRHEIPSRFMT